MKRKAAAKPPAKKPAASKPLHFEQGAGFVSHLIYNDGLLTLHLPDAELIPMARHQLTWNLAALESR